MNRVNGVQISQENKTRLLVEQHDRLQEAQIQEAEGNVVGSMMDRLSPKHHGYRSRRTLAPPSQSYSS